MNLLFLDSNAFLKNNSAVPLLKGGLTKAFILSQLTIKEFSLINLSFFILWSCC